MSLLGDTSKLEYSDSVFRSPGRDPAGGKSHGTCTGVTLSQDFSKFVSVSPFVRPPIDCRGVAILKIFLTNLFARYKF